MKKFSKQRQCIIENLKNGKDHPTAESLYLDLKKEMPNIGIATVYRNLSELCEEGMVLKIKSNIGPDRFDGNVMPHIHFICEKCGKVDDVFINEDELNISDKVKDYVCNELGGIINTSTISLNGICKNCK